MAGEQAFRDGQELAMVSVALMATGWLKPAKMMFAEASKLGSAELQKERLWMQETTKRREMCEFRIDSADVGCNELEVVGSVGLYAYAR